MKADVHPKASRPVPAPVDAAAAANPLATMGAVLEAQDSLGIAACVFDEADHTLLWNRSFLRFFPEHDGRIHVGEPYRANLRRFYEGRLDAVEMPLIERYIEEGVARHRAQQRPFAFEHRGVPLWVASLPLPGVGRLRIWQAGPPTLTAASAGVAQSLSIGGAALFDHVADGVMVTGADDRIAWVNEPFSVMYRLRDRGAASGQCFAQIYQAAWRGLEDQDRSLFESGMAALAEHMRFTGAPFEVPLPGARWSRVVEQRSPDGMGFFAHVDISVLKRQQQQLLEAERRARESEAVLKEKSALLEATLERMEQGIMMVSPERIVEVCNRRARELLDLPRSLMDHRPTVEDVVRYQWAHGEFVHTPTELIEVVRNGGIYDRVHCYDRQRPDGRVIEVSSVPTEGGGVLRTYTDITERKRAEERIRHVARHDGLTSLVNREVFLEYLEGAIADPACAGEGFAVHYIDIDKFKPINDSHGHAIGDKVLALVAERMRQIARDGDVVARMGGDEFAVLQYRVDHAERACGLAQRLLEGIARPMEIESLALCVGASAGIALYPVAGADADTLMRNADAAMYAAKAAGNNGVRVFGGPARSLSAAGNS